MRHLVLTLMGIFMPCFGLIAMESSSNESITCSDSAAVKLCKIYGLYGYEKQQVSSDVVSSDKNLLPTYADVVSFANTAVNKSSTTEYEDSNSSGKITSQKRKRGGKNFPSRPYRPLPETIMLYYKTTLQEIEYLSTQRGNKMLFFYQYIPDHSFFLTRLAYEERAKFTTYSRVFQLTGDPDIYLIGKEFSVNTPLMERLLYVQHFVCLSYPKLIDHDAYVTKLFNEKIVTWMGADYKPLRMLHDNKNTSPSYKISLRVQEIAIKKWYRQWVLYEFGAGCYVDQTASDAGIRLLKQSSMSNASQEATFPRKKR